MNEVNAREMLAESKFYESYSRYRDDLERYETWSEAVGRVINMHRQFFADKMTPELSKIIDEAEDAYCEKLFLGAQRTLQFGGEQILKNNSKLYNCTASYADRPSVFQDAMFLLLSGCGVGLSILKKYVNKLPEIRDRKKAAKVFKPEDSIEGWADCVGVLMSSYFVGGGTFPEYEGRRVYFDLTDIRPKGAKISGGFLAPGPEPLRMALDKMEYLLQGLILKGIKRLRPIHVYDLVMFGADAVISGGVRRSATDMIFDADDEEMATAKTGNWFVDNPQRGRSNNSALLLRDQVTKDQFHSIMEHTRQFGEPGFVWAADDSIVYNPCFTGDTLVAVADGRNAVSIKELAGEGNFPVYSAHFAPKKFWKADVKWATAFKSGTKPVVTINLSDGSNFRCTFDHKLAKASGGYVKACDSVGEELAKFFTTKTKYRTINSETNGYARQYRMIWEFHNGPKPLGFEIDHIQNNEFDGLSNLQLLDMNDHLGKTSIEREGENNPVHRIKNKGKWSTRLSRRSFMENNPRFKGVTDEMLIAYGKELLAEGKRITFGALYTKDNRCPMAFSKNRFGGKISNLRAICLGEMEYIPPVKLDDIEEIFEEKETRIFVVSVIDNGEIEDVYDLTVEDNHNFYIITNTEDENYNVCSGVLVHNCFEIGMYPLDVVSGKSGFQACNLAEINGSRCSTKEEFFRACRNAAAVCTLQAAYTSFPYLGEATENIVRRESLIGVSITGWMNNVKVLFDEETLKEGARIVKETNAYVAKLIGINPAARCTTTKPSGNASVLLQTASGIHAEHAPRYLRNAQMNKETDVAKLIKRQNPYMVEKSVWSANGTDFVVSFPVVASEGSLYKSDLYGVDMLEKVKFAQKFWVEEGTNLDLCVNKTIRHNISNTIVVKDDQWQEVEDFVYDNREYFAGISFLAASGDLDYAQAPFTTVKTEQQIIDEYGSAALFASGLIVDGLKVFSNLWTAIDTARNSELSNKEELDSQSDWIRRFYKFADNYFDSDSKKAEYCLKDVHLLHRWEKIVKNLKPIDFVSELGEKKFVDVDTLAAVACSGGSCEIAW